MKKKIVGILVMTLLIATAYSSLGLEENISSSLNSSIDAVDQHNPSSSEQMCCIDIIDNAFAQAFIPAHTPLSKVQLISRIAGTPPEHINFTVSIRDALDGDDIVSSTINSDDFEAGKVDFVFSDTELMIGMTYYIVITADKIETGDDGHWWRTSLDTYENGELWVLNGGQWQIVYYYERFFDLGFTTYWRDYAPDDCGIDGPTDGKAQEFTYYNFCTNDPEGHDVRYYIEWGDGIEFKWIGPYESDEIVEKGHSWASKDNYTIRVKAKDVYGAEGEWTELEVSMPKTKKANTPFLTFLENHPRLFPLLRQILGL